MLTRTGIHKGFSPYATNLKHVKGAEDGELMWSLAMLDCSAIPPYFLEGLLKVPNARRGSAHFCRDFWNSGKKLPARTAWAAKQLVWDHRVNT